MRRIKLDGDIALPPVKKKSKRESLYHQWQEQYKKYEDLEAALDVVKKEAEEARKEAWRLQNLFQAVCNHKWNNGFLANTCKICGLSDY